MVTAREPERNPSHLIPEGVHLAICCGVYDFGTQYNQHFDKKQHRVMLVWELPEERLDVERDGQTMNLPCNISKEYNLSLHEKAILRLHLEAWRGQSFSSSALAAFELGGVLGIPCQLRIIHKESNGNIYSKIASIMGIPKGISIPDLENPIRYFSFENQEHGTIPEGTPSWITEKIKEAEEWKVQAGDNEPAPPPDDDSDLPF